MGLVVEGANRHDMKLVRQTLESVPAIIAAKRDEFLFGPVEVEGVDLEAELARVREPEWEPDLEAPVPESGLCLDAGFDYDEVREVAAGLGYTTHPPRGHPAREARKNRPCKPGKRRGAGWSSAPTRGSTAIDASSSAGRRKPTTTSLCCIWPAHT